MSKQFWLIVVVIVGVFIGIVSFGKNSASSSSKPTSHVEGKTSSTVTLVEYGDYQCPYCGEYHNTIQQVIAQYGDKIAFQFRNFPLTSIHQNAYAAARAAEAAGLMGKFWEMHNLLYEQNLVYYNSSEKTPTWIGVSDPIQVFVQYAKSLGLDTTKFQQLYSSEQVNNLILADESAGNNLNVNATPSFFLNGKQIQVNNTLQDFTKVIDAALNTKSVQSSGSTSQTKN